ncbi:hypothetical protein IDJ77_20890 [Mucilaginibacter sp. ZT4R22]|uniref:Membrane protein (TIGR02226 family) n=1 Tax=Mucilaginibacter pankratovii TaxID=2772110 RepID=A0ABR7WVG7_9SPHI|nr:hypothetical protein [Mucilaginibacter pankratovii]MBD1366282.1 hypothetical protein [Mucilaginibacter pankratovii]
MMQANWNYMVIGLCVLLAIFLLWQEVSRANKKWLWYRIIAVLIASAMLACIALPISYQKFDAANPPEEFVLLTQGFNADTLKSNANQKVFAIDGAVKKAFPKAILLSSLDELCDTLQAHSLHIYGNGLSPFKLAQLDSAAVIFHPSEPPSGVSHISWKEKLKAGQELQVQGRYRNPSAQKVKLLLKGLNTILDTVTIKPNAQADFDLTTLPKTTGKVVYTLQSVLDADTITLGSIPVQTDAIKPLKVLMLSASPGFEVRFLKNWLSQNGYAVAVRSAISKYKYNSEFINIPQFSLDRLTPPTLSKFDIVMGDLSTFNTLSAADASSLKQEVENKGLGVIVQADSTGKTSWLQKDFPLDKLSGKEVVSSLIIDGKKSASAQLNIGNTFIRYQNGTQPLVTGPQNRILAGGSIAGSGKLVVTTLGNTYTSALSGNQQDYSALWSALISKAARRDTSIQNTFSVQGLPVVGEPVQLQVASGKTSAVSINGETVAIEQNPAIPFEWNVNYHPARSGWQSLVQNGKTEWWYAFDKTDWDGVQNTAKIAATDKYALENQPGHIVTKQIHQKLRIEVPKIYFYILLLAACTFLWVDRKLF